MDFKFEPFVMPKAYVFNTYNTNANTKISSRSLKSNHDLEYETNTKRNIFLKEYLEIKARNEGVKIPAGMEIHISSYKFDDRCRSILRRLETKKYWNDTLNWWRAKSDKNKSIEQYCADNGLTQKETNNVLDLYRFNYVRVKIYGARISDMFKLLAQDSQTVAQKTAQMNISPDDKTKILELKNFFDKYYKVEAVYNGKKIDLLHLQQEDKEELKKISPEFAQFIEKEHPELLKHTTYFAQQEMKAEELNESGRNSRSAAAILAAILTGNIAKGVYDAGKIKKGLHLAEKFMNHVKENPDGRNILDDCIKIYNDSGAEKGMEIIAKKMKDLGFEGGEHFIKLKAVYEQGMPKFVNPIRAFKAARGAALLGLILTALQGSADDCMGACKDFVQDQNNFGSKIALAIAALSVGAGIASSVAIAPTLDGMVAYNRAEKYLMKNGLIQPAEGINKLAKIGKLGIIGALFGMLVASSSSGSSWASMVLTRLKLGLNGKKLEEKNIITKNENTFAAANKNMMEYEAYKGKWSGITKGDWTIGAIGGATGLFTHNNPYIQSLSFGLQGCSETLTACAYQLLGNKVRDTQIEKDKKYLINSKSGQI